MKVNKLWLVILWLIIIAVCWGMQLIHVYCIFDPWEIPENTMVVCSDSDFVNCGRLNPYV